MNEVLKCIRLTPSILTMIVDQVRPERYGDVLEPGRFTLTEAIAHLADMEQIWLDRITLAYETPGAAVQGIDPEKRAEDKHYDTRDIHHELEVFDNRRRDTMEFLARLSKEDMARTVVHSTWGQVSIQDIVETVAGHDLYHIEQAAHYMR
jgi:uncharacterized damage-inducible protein DinB